MLNPKQERFVREYLADFNPRAAYIRAGYKGRGSSADVTACKLRKNPKIAAAVAEARQIIAEKAIAELALTKEWVLDELIDNVRKAKQGSLSLIRQVRLFDTEEISRQQQHLLL